jgi:DNA helicase-2/ATP-dependent DNA helicase PcrA
LLSLLRAYLESISLVADADTVDPSQGSVTLMTLHAAKGLEFHSVAMIGLEEGMLPHARAVTSGRDDDMEEERRLCFVGITRAMRRLLITSSKYRTMRGIPERTIPSRFLTEFGSEHVLFSDQSGALADLRDTEWGRDTGRYGTSRKDLPRGLDSAAAPPSMGTKIAKGLPVGAMVRHPQFGLGKVLTVTGGVNARATIQFKEVGVKTLVLEYARLTRV